MYGDVYAFDPSESARPQTRPVPGFLKSLYTIVSDTSTDDIICWNPEGTSFTIHDVSRFTTEILPQYYKHNNFSSFSRQLNFYSFKKVVDEDDDTGYLVTTSKPNTFEYRHRYFQRGRPDLLYKVVRKTNASAIKELAAEEKADRAKRKREGEMLAQLGAVGFTRASPVMGTSFTQLLMSGHDSMATTGHTQEYSEHGMDTTIHQEPVADENAEHEAAVMFMKQLVAALSGSLSGLQGNLQSLLNAGAAVIPLLACQANSTGTDLNELLTRGTTTSASLQELLSGVSGTAPAGGAPGSPLIAPAVLAEALGAVPANVRTSLVLSALANKVQHGELTSPAIANSMHQLSLQSPPGKMSTARSAGDGMTAAGVEESDDDDEMRALRNMKMRSRVRRRGTADSGELERSAGASDEEQATGLIDRRRIKRPRRLDATDVASSSDPATFDGTTTQPWTSDVIMPATAPARFNAGNNATFEVPESAAQGLKPGSLSTQLGLTCPSLDTPLANGVASSPAPATSLLSPTVALQGGVLSPSKAAGAPSSGMPKEFGVLTSPANHSTAWDTFLSLPTPSGIFGLGFARTPLAGYIGGLTPSLMHQRSTGPGALPAQPKSHAEIMKSAAAFEQQRKESSPKAVLTNLPGSSNVDFSMPSSVFSPSMLMLKGTSPLAEHGRLQTVADRVA